MKRLLSLLVLGLSVFGFAIAQNDYAQQALDAHTKIINFEQTNTDTIEVLRDYKNGMENRYFTFQNAAASDKATTFTELELWWNGRAEYLTNDQTVNTEEWTDVQQSYSFLTANKHWLPEVDSFNYDLANGTYKSMSSAIGQFGYLKTMFDEATVDFATATPTSNQSEIWCKVFPLTTGCPNVAEDDPDAGQIQGLWEPDPETGNNLFQTIPRVIQILLRVAASLIFLGLLWTGVQMLVSGGDDEAMANAKQYFLWVVIGAIVISLAYTIVQIVYNFFAS